MFSLEKRGFGDDSGDSLDDSPGAKAAHKTVISTGGSTCRHGHAWIGRKAKAIGQKCEKPWENQGFLAERTGTEQPTNSLGKTGVPK
jgi:hypothetical protein